MALPGVLGPVRPMTDAENGLLKLLGLNVLGPNASGADAGVGRPHAGRFVHCDCNTLTAADLAAGRLQLLIGIAPLQLAEFVLIRLTLQAAV